MDVSGLLIELFGRVHEHVHGIVEGLSVDDLVTVPEDGSNPVGWLVWHLTRIHDMHLGEILEVDQLWVAGDWGPRFGVTSDPWNIGFGHTPADVAAVRPESWHALVDYYDAVEARTLPLLGSLTPADLDRIVDRRFDPPVSMGVRLVSVADDSIQHAGQAAYVKGLLQRR